MYIFINAWITVFNCVHPVPRCTFLHACKHTDTHNPHDPPAYLLKVIGGVNARFDLALVVELQQFAQGLENKLVIIQVAEVEATHCLVGMHQPQCVNSELVVPGLCQG